MKPFTKKIVLESGREFYGYGFGADREATGEIVFNTSMVGYQEILSDPSYTDQMVVMTYPLIGNYGITDEDYETKYPTIGGMIVREYNDLPSNFRYTKTLGEVCEEYGIPCVWGIDTRMLTRIIRDEGTQRVIVVDASMPQEEALRRLKEAPVRRDMVERVSCRKRWFSRTANHRFDVVAVDCGIKHNIIRKLNEKGCNVTVVPYDITAEEVMAFRPDGLFLSNGPGDPTDVQPVIEMVRTLRGRLPIFGICLGHQSIGAAFGAEIVHAKELMHGKQSLITQDGRGIFEGIPSPVHVARYHSLAVDEKTLPDVFEILARTEDGEIMAMQHKEYPLIGIQFHPESIYTDHGKKMIENFLKL